MKNKIYILIVVAMGFNFNMDAQSDLTKVAEEAKNTLSEMASNGFAGDVNPKLIQSSELGSEIEEYLVNFDRYIAGGNQYQDVSRSDNKVHFPLMTNQSVNSTVTVNNQTRKATSFNNTFLTQELNNLPDNLKANKFRGVRLYRVPNLNAYVYVDDQNNAYTSYNNRSLKEARNADQLYKDLQQAAVRYQNKYGNQIKNNRLLH